MADSFVGGGFTPDSILPSRERAREILKSPNAVPQFSPSSSSLTRKHFACRDFPADVQYMNPSSCKQFGRQFPFFFHARILLSHPFHPPVFVSCRNHSGRCMLRKGFCLPLELFISGVIGWDSPCGKTGHFPFRFAEEHFQDFRACQVRKSLHYRQGLKRDSKASFPEP